MSPELPGTPGIPTVFSIVRFVPNVSERFERETVQKVQQQDQCSAESLEIQAVMLEVICPVPIAFGEELLNSTNVRDLRVDP